MYLIPNPQKWKQKEGEYILTYDSKIVIAPNCETQVYDYAVLLNEELQTDLGYRLLITRGMSEKTAIRLLFDVRLSAVEYEVEISEQGITVSGGSCRGILYAVQTIRQLIRQAGACIPYMYIRDYPEIVNRGMYYDVTRGRIPKLSYLKKLADKLAFYKMNQMQLYVEHSFLFEGLSEMWRDDTPLTAQDILELDTYCRKLNVELVPSIACFGHLYKLLRTQTFQHLCELPDSGKEPFGFVDRMAHHTLDSTNPESMSLIKRLIEEYMPLFTSRYFNIGADETFDLGKGKSRERAEEIGTDRLYIQFVKELCEFVVSKGRIPMFWGDIICEFPEAIQELPKETICLNWGYAKGQDDASVRKLWEIGAVQYTCPGVSGWDQFVNQIEVSYENIKRMCTYARHYGAVGVLNTDWGDYGHINHPDFSITGMIYGAAFSWNSEIPEFEEINRRISRIEYRDSTEQFVSIIAAIAENWVYNWHHAVRFFEKKEAAFSAEQLQGTEEALEGLKIITNKLYHIIPQLDTQCRKQIQPYFVAIQGMELIQKIGLVFSTWEVNERTFSIHSGKLAEELESWFYEYKKVWRTVSRESELYRIQHIIFWYADALRSGSEQ